MKKGRCSIETEIRQWNEEKQKTPFREEWLSWMLEHLGSTDPDLRDGLIYPVFCRLLTDGGLTAGRVNDLLEVCLDERHLYYNIGEKNTDSVYMRSFSSLVIAAILIADKDRPMLETGTVHRSAGKMIRYLELEEDRRGWTGSKGWAHSIAHGADMLAAYAGHPDYNPADGEAILTAVQRCLLTDEVYTDGEEGRLIYIIEAMLDAGLKPCSLESWVKGVFQAADLIWHQDSSSLASYRIRTNASRFMESLFFRMQWRDVELAVISEGLHRWHRQDFE